MFRFRTREDLNGKSSDYNFIFWFRDTQRFKQFFVPIITFQCKLFFISIFFFTTFEVQLKLKLINEHNLVGTTKVSRRVCII